MPFRAWAVLICEANTMQSTSLILVQCKQDRESELAETECIRLGPILSKIYFPSVFYHVCVSDLSVNSPKIGKAHHLLLSHLVS